MFLRKLKKRSGSISAQIISKEHPFLFKLFRALLIQKLVFFGKQEIERLKAQGKFFVSENDVLAEQLFEAMDNASIKTVGPEIICGKIYDRIGFDAIDVFLFRHLVIARLA